MLWLCCILYSTHLFSQKDELQHAFQKLQQNNIPDSARAEAYRYLSFLYQGKNLDSALLYGSKAIETALITGNQLILAKTYAQQASNYVWSSKPDTALKLYFNAVKICNIIKANDVLFECYNGIAYLYETTSTYDKALEYSKKALQISYSLNDVNLSAFSYHEMASVCMGLKNYHDALSYFIKAKSGFIKLNNLDRVASCCSDMSRTYLAINLYSQAVNQLDSALKIFNYLDEPIQAAEVYEGYGEVYTQTKQYTSAQSNYNIALEIYQQNHLDDDEARIEMDLGKMFLTKQDYLQAKTWVTKSYNFFKQNDEKEEQLASIIELAQIDSAIGNSPATSLSFLKEYKALSDTLNLQKNNLRSQELLIEFDLERKEKENQLLRQENEITRNRFIITMWGSIISLLGAVGLFLLYRQKRKANIQLKKSQQQTDEAYEELKEVSRLKDKLFSILAHDLRSPLANTQHLLQLTRTGAIDKDIFEQLAGELELNLDYNRELLDNLLNWASNQMNGISVNLKRIKLRKLVSENFSLFTSLAEKKQVKLQNKIDALCTIIADENIMRLALRNVISNAIKFSHSNKNIIITTQPSQHKLLIIISDEGIGISAEQQKNIFTLHTNSTPGTQQEKGAGIGLRITLEMIEKMGGKVWIESQENKGTSVFIEVDKPDDFTA